MWLRARGSLSRILFCFELEVFFFFFFFFNLLLIEKTKRYPKIQADRGISSLRQSA